jgi:hypothetical protein
MYHVGLVSLGQSRVYTVLTRCEVEYLPGRIVIQLHDMFTQFKNSSIEQSNTQVHNSDPPT